LEEKAYIVTNRNSAKWNDGCPTRKPDIKGAGILCVVPAKTPQELIEIIGGEYGWRLSDKELRPAIIFLRNLFSPCSDNKNLLRYQKGPLTFFLGKDETETYIFFVETVLFMESRVKVAF